LSISADNIETEDIGISRVLLRNFISSL